MELDVVETCGCRQLVSEPDLVPLLVRVVDPLQRDVGGSEVVPQLGQSDSVPQSPLQLHWAGKLRPQNRLHPPEQETTNQKRFNPVFRFTI